jgi:hypothetical protein
METIAPFLTEAGLAKMNGTSTDGFFSLPTKSLSPNEAQNHLTKFLRDDFRFSSVFDIYAFLAILNSASSTNKSWVSRYELALKTF